jgi:hypothetical protein
MPREEFGDVRAGKGHQEIVTSTTPWLGSAICAKPSGDMSTTRGYPAPSRSSTVQVVDAPVALLVTVSAVPNGSVGLAHMPGAAPEYHVASPTSEAAGAGGDATTGSAVVVVGGGSGGGAVVVVVVGGTVVVVVGGTVVVGGGVVVVVVVAAGAR